MNLATFLVAAVVAVIFAAIVLRGHFNRRHGRGSCSCGGDCSSCPSGGNCKKV